MGAAKIRCRLSRGLRALGLVRPCSTRSSIASPPALRKGQSAILGGPIGWIEGPARFEDPIGQGKEFSHCGGNDRHLGLSAGA